MPFLNIRFISGLCIGLLSPSLLWFFIVAIGSIFIKGPGAWAPGPQCYALARKKALSPDGRFIATSVMIHCEDDEETQFWYYNYAFVTATRLARTGHVYSLKRKSKTPADIVWLNNRLIALQIDENDSEKIALSWCGVAATSEVRASP